MTSAPHLTFFCELEPTPLTELFAQPAIFEALKALDASVSLGLLDLSPERARVAQQLSTHGIPLTAWLLLPKAQGYWFNLENAEQAAQRVEDFFDWSDQHALRWCAVGLDIEPDIHALGLLARNRRAGLRRFWSNLAERERFTHAAERYAQIVANIHARGLAVESYQFPFLVDERRAGSRLLQRLSGVVDLPVDREVLMLYSSFYTNFGAALLHSYAREAGGIGLGSTGGGVTMEGLVSAASLTWDAFQRDLLLAAPVNPWLYIFSLEGCWQQGFLERLRGFDWSAPAEPAARSRIIEVSALRALLRGVLRLSRCFLR